MSQILMLPHPRALNFGLEQSTSSYGFPFTTLYFKICQICLNKNEQIIESK